MAVGAYPGAVKLTNNRGQSVLANGISECIRTEVITKPGTSAARVNPEPEPGARAGRGRSRQDTS
jgi:hypothetical protein